MFTITTTIAVIVSGNVLNQNLRVGCHTRNYYSSDSKLDCYQNFGL